MTTVAAAVALLVGVGYAPPQAAAIGHFMWRAAHLGRSYSSAALIDPCARSALGEGLVDVTGILRGELHRFASDPDVGNRSLTSCVPAAVQIAWLAQAFPRHYPTCAARFAAGDLAAFDRCWGKGRRQ